MATTSEANPLPATSVSAPTSSPLNVLRNFLSPPILLALVVVLSLTVLYLWRRTRSLTRQIKASSAKPANPNETPTETSTETSTPSTGTPADESPAT